MSAIFSSAALRFDHTAAELADLDSHDSVRREREPAHCVLLTDEQMAAVDDMAGFIKIVKATVRGDFIDLGFGNTAAGELADLHIGAVS